MFKAEMSNGVYYGFGSFKEFYHRVMRNLKYTVHCHTGYDSESAMIYVNGEFVAWLSVSTYTVCIRTFATVNSGTKFICNERMNRKMKIWFTKTSYYSSLDGCEREFNNLDEAVKCLIEECSNDGNERNPELIIYKDIYSKENKCDYIIELYDDWRE